MGSPPFGTNPRFPDPLCLPLFISQNKRGNKRERRDQRAVGRPQAEDSLVHLEALAGLAGYVQDTQFKLNLTVGFDVPLALCDFCLELPGQASC